MLLSRRRWSAVTMEATSMRFCESLSEKVKTTEEWKAEHAEHVDAELPFASEPFPHPSGTWFWLVCPCGAKHLCDEAKERPQPTH
jgi:hypothetical protein